MTFLALTQEALLDWVPSSQGNRVKQARSGLRPWLGSKGRGSKGRSPIGANLSGLGYKGASTPAPLPLLSPLPPRIKASGQPHKRYGIKHNRANAAAPEAVGGWVIIRRGSGGRRGRGDDLHAVPIGQRLERPNREARLPAWLVSNRSQARPARRRAYLTAMALAELTDPNSAVGLLGCRGYIEASLARWVSGGLVYGDRRGRFLYRLDGPPSEVWEVRVTEPAVQVRLFCRFAEPDTLIFTRFHTRRLLGRKGSPEWVRAMTDCERTWEILFPSTPPFRADMIREYVTENCDDFPI